MLEPMLDIHDLFFITSNNLLTKSMLTIKIGLSSIRTFNRSISDYRERSFSDISPSQNLLNQSRQVRSKCNTYMAGSCACIVP